MTATDPCLQVLDVDGTVTREVVLAAGTLEIGRAVEGLACPDDAHMADRHARVSAGPGGIHLSDTGEGSGVWIRVDARQGRRLRSGDQIWLGSQIVVLRQSGKDWDLHHHGSDGRLAAVHRLGPPGVFLGRASDLTLDVHDGGLSRRHAQIVVEDDGLRVYDRGAHNGTWVRVTDEEPLDPGDEFRAATHRFRLATSEIATPPGRPAPPQAPIDPEATVVATGAVAAEPTPALDAPTHDAPDDASAAPKGLAARLRGLASRPATGSEEGAAPAAADPPAAAAGDPVLIVLDAEAGSVSVEARPGMTVLDAVREAGLERGEPLDWECGDGGCGVCVVGVVEGADRLDPPDPSTGEMKTIQITEQVVPDPNRYRLACLARVRGTVRLRKLT